MGAWSTAPGTPDYCNLRIADHPETMGSQWIACPSGRAGCRQLATTWTKNIGHTVEAQRPSEPVRLIGGTAYFLLQRLYPPSDPTKGPYVGYIDVIEPLDGPPVLAVGAAQFPWKTTTAWCFIAAAFGDYGFGFDAVPRDPDLPLDAAGSDLNVFASAPWSAPAALTTTSWSPSTIGAPGAYFTSFIMGGHGFWLNGEAPETTFAFDVTTKTGVVAQNRPPTESASGAPDGAVVLDGTTPYSISWLHDDGSMTRLATPTSPQVVTWKTLDRSSGPDLVWVESDDTAGYSNPTLWTAPLVANEASLVRRKVAKINDATLRGGARSPANKGVFLTVVGRSTALLTRLSDGMGWLIQAEPQTKFVDAVWVDDNDVFLETADDSQPQFDSTPPSGIMRLSRATLGAPTVASGL